MPLKKIFFVLSLLFAAVTFGGAGYVLLHRGTANAGYAVIPMLFCLVCMQGYQNIKRNQQADPPPRKRKR